MRPSQRGLLNCTDRCPVSLILVPWSRLPRSRSRYNGQRSRRPSFRSSPSRRLQRDLVLVDKPRSFSYSEHRLVPAGAASGSTPVLSPKLVSFPAPRFFPSLLVSGGQVTAQPVQQDLVSLSRRKVSFSFDKQHWPVQRQLRSWDPGTACGKSSGK